MVTSILADLEMEMDETGDDVSTKSYVAVTNSENLTDFKLNQKPTADIVSKII